MCQFSRLDMAKAVAGLCCYRTNKNACGLRMRNPVNLSLDRKESPRRSGFSFFVATGSPAPTAVVGRLMCNSTWTMSWRDRGVVGMKCRISEQHACNAISVRVSAICERTVFGRFASWLTPNDSTFHDLRARKVNLAPE